MPDSRALRPLLGDIVIFAGARWAVDENTTRLGDIEVIDGRIHFPERRSGRASADASGLLLLPGLINAHDHLEFNLFPRLSYRLYSNAGDWAFDVHRPGESPVREHIAVPLAVRLMWGGIRNLLSGVTTVAHHNPYQPEIFNDDFPVRVIRNFGWAHSLAFSADLPKRLRDTPHGWPFIVHAAEGTDEQARSEIDALEALGMLTPRTVLVHANAVQERDLETLRNHGASVIWCPRSNLATYGRTLSLAALRSGVSFALGTDSAITSGGDLIDEIRTAVLECSLDLATVWRIVTTGAASVLRLNRGEGRLAEGGVADIVAVKDHGQSPAEALLDLRPEFVMVGGRFRLLTEAAAANGWHSAPWRFQPIGIATRNDCLIDAPVDSLYGEASRLAGPDLFLAGRAISVGTVQ